MGDRNVHPTDLQILTVTTAAEFDRCIEIRMVVFVQGQNVPVAEEVDGLDDACTHILAQLGGLDIGTARLWMTDSGDAKAQRVAVLAAYREQGVGRELMNGLEEIAREKRSPNMILGAQLEAIPFYEKLGYAAYGPIFDDAGIDHRMMRKKLE